MNWWKDHGTKITGYSTAAIGFIAVSDPKLIVDLVGESWGNRIFRWCLVLAGIITAYRGHENTRNQETPQ